MQSARTDATIRQTLDSVFRSTDYNQSLTDILIGNVIAFVQRVQAAIAQMARNNPATFWVTLGILLLIIVIVLWRGAWLARQRARLLAMAAGGERGQVGGAMSDAWRLAQQLAERGEYADAAHALYRHLLGWLAASENVELHPSKTVGDYARELRARSSRVFGPYREFARNYEVVVYGTGACDQFRYDRLLALATSVTSRNV